MDKIEILQKMIEQFSKEAYHGVYLWKYIQYEMITGITEYQNNDKNVALECCSDVIPMSSREQLCQVKENVELLKEKEILVVLLSLRRWFKGKLEHTAMEPYLQALTPSQYQVIELGNVQIKKEKIPTQSWMMFGAWDIARSYGLEEIDKKELMEFFFIHYVYPLQNKFQVKISDKALRRCICNLSVILQIRNAFLLYFSEVLKRIKPKVICYSHGENMLLCFLKEAAQKMGIPTVEIAHGEGVRTIQSPPQLQYADYFLVHSDVIADKMHERGWNNVFAVGKPYIYDTVIQNEFSSDRAILISVISSLEKGLFEQVKELAKRLDKMNYLIAFKTHSSEIWEEEEQEKIKAELGNWEFLDETVDVREVFELSDIIIGMRSSGIIDALPYDTKKIIVLEDKSKDEAVLDSLEFWNTLCEWGDMVKVSNIDELEYEVKTYQRGRIYRGGKKYYWPMDAVDRFNGFIQLFLDKKKPDKN